MQLQLPSFRFDIREVRPATAVLLLVWTVMFIAFLIPDPTNLIVYGIFVVIGFVVPWLADLFDYLFGW